MKLREQKKYKTVLDIQKMMLQFKPRNNWYKSQINVSDVVKKVYSQMFHVPENEVINKINHGVYKNNSVITRDNALVSFLRIPRYEKRYMYKENVESITNIKTKECVKIDENLINSVKCNSDWTIKEVCLNKMRI